MSPPIVEAVFADTVEDANVSVWLACGEVIASFAVRDAGRFPETDIAVPVDPVGEWDALLMLLDRLGPKAARGRGGDVAGQLIVAEIAHCVMRDAVDFDDLDDLDPVARGETR